MLNLLASLSIYTEDGHQYDTKSKEILIKLRENTDIIEIPASVKEIEAGYTSTSAFSLCSQKIKEVSFSKGSNLVKFGASLLEETTVETVDFSNCEKLLNIFDACCRNCKKLNKIVLPPNVKEIGYGAFSGSNIREITFPDSLETISNWNPTYGCAFCLSKLERVIINANSNLKTIGQHAFLECYNYNGDFFIPRKAKLGEAVFSGTPVKNFIIDPENPNYSSDGKTIYNKEGNEIVEVSIYNFNENYKVRENVTKIGKQAFRKVPGKTIVFTNQSVEISTGAFFGTNIEEINYPTEATEVSTSFAKESSLKKVVIGSKVTTIMNSAFSFCKSLSEVVIESDKLEKIEQGAFLNCISLKKLVIPQSVVFIEPGAFSSCNPDIIFDFKNTTRFQYKNGILFCDETFVDYINDFESNEIVIPNNIKTIPRKMFESKKLKSISFQETSIVEAIEKEAFTKSTIRSIVFPPSVKSIGENCFSSCEKLETVEFDGTVTLISEMAFYNCTSLSQFIIKPTNSIEEIGNSAFSFCSSIKTFEIEKMIHLITIGESAFSNAFLPSFQFPKSLTTIKPKAFQNSLITLVTFADDCNIAKIPSYCFDGSTKLEKCTLSSLTTTIDTYAFSRCISLMSFELGSSIEVIQQFSFTGSIQLSKIVIPSDSKLQYIMGHAFKNTSLSTFEVQEGADFRFEDGLLMNGNTTKLIYFIPDENIKMLVIPGSIEIIGDYAFQQATYLKEVFIPEGVFKKIGLCSFQGCTSLKRITLPSTTQIIESYAFDGCNEILCGGLFIKKATEEIKKAARHAGIQELPLSPECLNNYNALARKNTCKYLKIYNKSLFATLALVLLF